MATNSLMDTIQRRKSVRTYSGDPLTDAQRRDIADCLARLEPEYGVRLALLKNEYGGQQFGTYGVIKRPAAYLAVACGRDADALRRAGMALEVAVLRCTELGQGTCWLGGTFKRDQFKGALTVGEGEIVPVVIALGKAADKERWMDGVMRFIAKPGARKPYGELFFDGAFGTPLMPDGSPEATALEMVRIGPSASNKQPWRVIKAGGGYHFYVEHAPGYQKMGFDMQVLDVGIAMAHFALSMRELGRAGHFEVLHAAPVAPPEGTEYMVSFVPV